MRVLITGGQGMLAESFSKLLIDHEVLSVGREEMDVTSMEKVYRVFDHFRPDIVIHLAAFTNVEACEADVDIAKSVNVEGSKNIAETSKKFGCKLVYLSSTGVYGKGKSTPWTEDDIPDPTTVHPRILFDDEL